MSYIYYNNNPKNLRTGDCVIRAISRANHITWKEVYKDLADRGIEKGLIMNERKNFIPYLKSLGWIQEKCIRDEYGKRISVEELSKILGLGTYIVNTRKHLTVIEDGNIYDTWDTSKETPGKFYRKED